MSTERIQSSLLAPADRSPRRGGGFVRQRLRTAASWLGWLNWQQWLVLFSMGSAVITIEVNNHTTMWVEHQSGQTLWTDPELIMEIVLFGLVFPILAGIVLGYVGRTAVERDEMARQLELRRSLVAQMHETATWRELAELVVSLPADLVAADRAWLLAQSPGEEEFDQITYWADPRSGLLSPGPSLAPSVCEQCAIANAGEGNRVFSCQHMDHAYGPTKRSRYCLWLSSEGAGKAALVFELPEQQAIEPHQLKLLDDLGDEMAMAIDNAGLNAVRQRQVDAAKNERLRIARDLHDTLGQNLSYLRFRMEHLSDTLLAGGRNEFQEELSRMLVVADEAYEQMRDTLEELRATEQRDFEEAVRIYATKAATRAGFSVTVTTSGEPGSLSTRKSRQLMYIVREALNNVEKHAAADHVAIHLQWSTAQLELTVCDDGRGFEPSALRAESRYGMTIMEERSQAINARLRVESAPGAGTTLTLRLPLANSTAIPLHSQ
jgi:signal transduction histidine kinase